MAFTVLPVRQNWRSKKRKLRAFTRNSSRTAPAQTLIVRSWQKRKTWARQGSLVEVETSFVLETFDRPRFRQMVLGRPQSSYILSASKNGAFSRWRSQQLSSILRPNGFWIF